MSASSFTTATRTLTRRCLMPSVADTTSRPFTRALSSHSFVLWKRGGEERPNNTMFHSHSVKTQRPIPIIQKRSMFIQTTETPNPESIKFIPGRPVLTTPTTGDASEATGFYITSTSPKIEIAKSPLAQILFKIEGVKGVYLGPDFITVTKTAETSWSHVRTMVFSGIMDHYATGKPALLSTPEISDTFITEDDSEVVAMIKELLESRIRPAVMEDGGDIKYIGFDVDTGIVQVQLAGSCVGCPSSSVTLKNGVENMLMHYIPEVTGVESVMDEEEGTVNDGEVVVEQSEDAKKAKTYEERLRAAGIPFSD